MRAVMTTTRPRALRRRLLGALGLLGAARMIGACETTTETERCFTWETEDPCPDVDAAWDHLPDVDSIDGGPYYAPAETYDVGDEQITLPPQCCYDVTVTTDSEWESSCQHGFGRPLLDAAARPRVAARRSDGGWARGAGRPRMAALGEAQRVALHEAWLARALGEHASVASFSRFALELMKLGAPARLVRDAHRSALDEVRHAEVCFALASAFDGHPVGAGPLGLGAALELAADVEGFARRTAIEGCIEETVGACVLAEQLSRATDPAVRRALVRLSRDEERHAELAWTAAAWAARSSPRARAALGACFAADALARHLEVPRRLAGIESHGVLDPHTERGAVERALADVVLPCASALV
jgi:hypothetical protein